MASIDLNESEQTILLAASNIFSGFISEGKIYSSKTAEKAVKYSVAIAIKLADEVDKNRSNEVAALGGDDPGPFPW
ncbi:MAG: hypothetical protein LJE83_11950 [Gammaproteobacteria bacterium]|jgi:hypothetical protein|nr:hypothetical protein [Gammaproteobacteria bacterium]